MEDSQSQSYNEQKLQSLRRQIQVPKNELLKLAYSDQKLLQKIESLNGKGCEYIKQQQFYEGIIYLNEAQRVLQYAAGCGRTIDRTLIIVILHNQACVYQRIWELNKSSDYLQAIIYNISNFINTQTEFQFTTQIANKISPEYQKLSAYLNSKLQLINYNLQYCAVSSQVKNHQNALRSAQKSLSWLKSYCEEIYKFQKIAKISQKNDFENNLFQELLNIQNFDNQNACDIDKNMEKLLYKARISLIGFQKKVQLPSVGLNRQEIRQLQSFSLGQVMQVSPIFVAKMQERLDLYEELTLVKKIYKAIYISISHFTMATQLRLIANQQHGIDSNIRKISKQFKQSQIHHLVSIITVALYVPCYTKYFQHILNSFKNHYQIDLTQTSELSQYHEISNYGDDLIHLQTQSVSQKEQEKELPKPNSSKTIKICERKGASFQKENAGHKTAQDIQCSGSGQSSENQYLRKLNHTGLPSEKKSRKQQSKSKKKLGQLTSRQKHTIIIKKITSKSRPKGKKQQQKSKRSKSRRSVHEVESQQKVVHYYHYDNYSKNVVKKKSKVNKEIGEYQLTKKSTKQIRDKRSPQSMINNHLKKQNKFSLSKKDYISPQLGPKRLKKGKSPQLSSSKAQKNVFKKGI